MTPDEPGRAEVAGGVLRMEWRAVFSYPPSILGPTPDSYGPERGSAKETEQDRPRDPEESHGWRSGTQTRLVTDWRMSEPTP